MTDPDGSDVRGAHLIRTFIDDCAQRLSSLATTPAQIEGAAALTEALHRSTPLPFEPGWLQALETLHAVEPTPLGRRFIEIAPLLPWEPTKRADDGGVDLALALLDRTRDMGELTVGIMYVRPGRQYPLHCHPPNELYLTIAGHAEWRFGGADGFRSIRPDTLIHNRPNDLHSAIAGDTPLVAFYVLW